MARFLEMRRISAEIDNAASQIMMINEERYASSDLLRLAQEIDRQCQKLDKVMSVLLEVNIGREESKGGVLPEQLEELLGQLAPLSHIQVRG